jgi:hypothetical protein
MIGRLFETPAHSKDIDHLRHKKSVTCDRLSITRPGRQPPHTLSEDIQSRAQGHLDAPPILASIEYLPR